MLRFVSLGSGSTGNATVVEAGDATRRTRLLIDCGLRLSELDARLARVGLHADDLDAVFVTHEHADHVSSACHFALRQQRPVWMSRGTHAAIGAPDLGGWLRVAQDAVPIALNGLHIHPFTVPHDAREPLQLRVGDGQVQLGIVTDLGHASAHVQAQLRGCEALLLECNHDPEMLAQSRYPPFLKKRISGRLGHLSNVAATQLLRQLAHPQLRLVVAAHLSLQNNRPALAQQALADALDTQPEHIAVARPDGGTPWWEV